MIIIIVLRNAVLSRCFLLLVKSGPSDIIHLFTHHLLRMKTFELNKLVKDKRYDDMIASGWNVKEDVLANNKKALIDALHAKRKEEIDEADKIAQEVPLDKKKLLDELADAQQVVNDIETTLPTEVRLDVYKKRIKNICAQHAIELQEILDLQVEKEAKE